jgi:choline-glycine betaine transporter
MHKDLTDWLYLIGGIIAFSAVFTFLIFTILDNQKMKKDYLDTMNWLAEHESKKNQDGEKRKNS